MANQVNKSGKIKTLLAQAIGSGYGPPNDSLDAEAIVHLVGVEEAFGLKLRAGDSNLSANLAMLSLLRDAYVHEYAVHLVGWFEPGKKNGRLARVALWAAGPGLEAMEMEKLERDFAEVVDIG